MAEDASVLDSTALGDEQAEFAQWKRGPMTSVLAI
jgi:hypothetical protein